jgi:hypothetical protein
MLCEAGCCRVTSKFNAAGIGLILNNPKFSVSPADWSIIENGSNHITPIEIDKLSLQLLDEMTTPGINIRCSCI